MDGDNDDDDNGFDNLRTLFMGKLDEREQRMLEQTGPRPDFVFHKQPLPDRSGKLILPEKATVTHVGEQNGVLHVWYGFAVGMLERVEISYALITTGEKIDFAFKTKLDFYRTVQMSNGEVWHVWFSEPKAI